MSVDLAVPTHPVVLVPALLVVGFLVSLLVVVVRRRVHRPIRDLRADVERLDARVDDLEARTGAREDDCE